MTWSFAFEDEATVLGPRQTAPGSPLPDTCVLFRFDEPAREVLPRDAAGGLHDPTAPSGLLLPDVGGGVLGRGRRFGIGRGLFALDAQPAATALRRDLTVEALVSVDTARASDGIRTIAARGLEDSPAERRLWGLELESVGAPATLFRLRLHWRTSAGEVSVVSPSFDAPARFLYLAATRRWFGAADVRVDFFLDGERVGTAVTTEGAIADGDGGHTTVGCAGDGAGGFHRFYEDTIDRLRLSRVARTPEAIRQTARQIALFPRLAVEALVAFLPPGPVYSLDPASAIQRELQVEGTACAIPWALAAELADDCLPNRATRLLDRWERVTGLAPRPGDAIETRRARVVAFLRKIHGFTRDQIVKAVAPLFAVEDDQVEILEHTNRFVDEFDGAEPSLAWFQEPNEGTIQVAAGALELHVPAGADARWDETIRRAVSLRATVIDRRGAELVAHLTNRNLPFGHAAGVFVYDHATGDAHAFAIVRVGTEHFVHRRIAGGVAETIVYPDVVPPGPLYLRIALDGAGGAALAFSTDSGWGPWSFLATAVATIADPRWAGPFLANGGPAPASADVALGSFSIWTPEGRHVFEWYVHAAVPPAGAPDLVGAQLVIDQMRPAHTRGLAVATTTFRCDDPSSLCDRDLLGGS